MGVKDPIFDGEITTYYLKQYDYNKILDDVREMLIPCEELGYTIRELDIKEPRETFIELAPTKKSNLVIILEGRGATINLSVTIPKLVDNNYLIVNGKRKLPRFQLVDVPTITKGNTLWIVTNTLQIQATPSSVLIFGKSIPLSLLSLAWMGYEKAKDLIDNYDQSGNELYTQFIDELKAYYEDSNGDYELLLKDIGRHYTKYNAQDKGENIIYALNTALRIDLYNRPFFKNGSIMEHIIEHLKNGWPVIDHLNFENKRIRGIEYFITAPIANNIFQFCLTNRKTDKPKFSVNSSHIISECNVSEIIQSDTFYNPIYELSELTRFSVIGPLAYRRISVPKEVRDIHDSMFGRVCPVDTPDRDNCGIVQSFCNKVQFDEKRQLSKPCNQSISITVSMVPFLDKNDQTRLQMASSQMRQAIMLLEPEPAFIQTGCETNYSHYTSYLKLSKGDGEVIYVDNYIVLVRYDTGELDIIDVAPRNTYSECIDYMDIKVRVGDRVKKDDIIAESNFLKNRTICLGKNLLTGIAIYYGYNYEDAIVISEKVVKENKLKSVHCVDLSFIVPENATLLSLVEDEYKPIPDLGEALKPNQPYAKMKVIPKNPMQFNKIFQEDKNLSFPKQIMIYHRRIYANSWNKSIPEYDFWVQTQIAKQKKDRSRIEKELKNIVSKEEIKEVSKIHPLLTGLPSKGKLDYRIKGEKLDGLLVELKAIFFREISVGDKLVNRHGNKGVISTIISEDETPQLPDGRKLDIIINPLGIISRMNIGQLFELHLGMALYELKQRAKRMLEKGINPESIKKYILKFYSIVDETPEKFVVDHIQELLDSRSLDADLIDSLVIIEPPFRTTSYKNLTKAMKYTRSKFEYPVYDPKLGSYFDNPIAVGYCYWLKVIHMAETKLSARCVGSYVRKTLQPTSGRSKGGGQRLGEMEVRAMIAMDGISNLRECLTIKSDAIDLKNKWLYETIQGGDNEDEFTIPEDQKPESLRLLEGYLKVLGVQP